MPNSTDRHSTRPRSNEVSEALGPLAAIIPVYWRYTTTAQAINRSFVIRTVALYEPVSVAEIDRVLQNDYKLNRIDIEPGWKRFHKKPELKTLYNTVEDLAAEGYISKSPENSILAANGNKIDRYVITQKGKLAAIPLTYVRKRYKDFVLKHFKPESENDYMGRMMTLFAKNNLLQILWYIHHTIVRNVIQSAAQIPVFTSLYPEYGDMTENYEFDHLDDDKIDILWKIKGREFLIGFFQLLKSNKVPGRLIEEGKALQNLLNTDREFPLLLLNLIGESEQIKQQEDMQYHSFMDEVRRKLLSMINSKEEDKLQS